jgi:HEAT repeat protein
MGTKLVMGVFAAFCGLSGLDAPRSGAQTVADAPPKIVNGRVETRTLSGKLPLELQTLVDKATEPIWAGYAVPEVAGDRILCCGNYNVTDEGVRGRCDNCRLEKGDEGMNVTPAIDDKIQLEGTRRIAVLVRMAQKKINQIRVVSAECTLDAGGRTVIWFTGVNPAESVAWLESLVATEKNGEHERRSVGDAALTAIAMHADGSADRALESFTAPGKPAELRKRASFWLGAARGRTGLTVLEKMAKNDPSPEVRGQVAFGFSVSHEPSAVDDLIRMARDDESAHARGQALFWLAQKTGQKATAAITGAIENDPNEEVKNKAVFALSQLPRDEGVPKLIEVAQTNRNPEVRKKAMFWLGQSNDPRALAFFEKILTQ